MTCPTCDHTMEKIDANEGGPQLFWCPRCGTLSKHHDVLAFMDDVSVPLLVERCQRFPVKELPVDYFTLWHSLGIEECLMSHDQRRLRQ